MVNPLAGYGGKLNYKGSDGLTLPSLEESVSIKRAFVFLSQLDASGIKFFVPSGPMGSDVLDSARISNYRVIYDPESPTTSQDTKEFVKLATEHRIDLFLFVGGDGTARDIMSSIDPKIPVVGIPAGVKMYSSVFAVNISRAAEFVNSCSVSKTFEKEMGEVVDIDEEQYRKGILRSKLFGQLLIPVNENIIGVSKAEYEDSGKEGIAEYLIENMDDATYYIIGPGSTCKFIMEELGLKTNILGFDILKGKKLVAEDAGESEIFGYVSESESRLVISPIGGQGFVIGRGNKQLSARVLRRIGMKNVIVVSTHEKLMSLKKLYMDLDEKDTISIPSYIKVLYGYGRYRLIPVIS